MCSFANSELWPRFHYEHSVTGGEKFDFSLWEAYKQANAQFADVILEAAGPGKRPARRGRALLLLLLLQYAASLHAHTPTNALPT
ncbi:hypothetical protein EON62_06220 [archaeon]|nr:MAG: hypothetical protein EON62_06220 [archaeon]